MIIAFIEVYYEVFPWLAPPRCESWAEADPYGHRYLTDWVSTPPECLVEAGLHPLGQCAPPFGELVVWGEP